MSIIFVLMWLAMSLHTFRYVGSYVKPREVGNECTWPSICSHCVCKNCNEPATYHKGGSRYSTYLRHPCEDYDGKRPHPAEYAIAGSLAAVWPVWYAYRGYARATVNMVGPSFFKEPSPILTKEQKQALEIKQREDDIAARDARILELEKEVGIV